MEIATLLLIKNIEKEITFNLQTFFEDFFILMKKRQKIEKKRILRSCEL